MSTATDNDRRLRKLEAIAKIASNFTFEHSLQAMMREVALQVVEGTGVALACIVGLGDGEGQVINRVAGTFGTPEGFDELLERTWRTAGTPLVSTSLRTRTVQVFDLATILQRDGYEGVREAQTRAGWASMAVVPMVYRGTANGLLIVAYPPGHTPDADELSFIGAISDQAAVAVENARLFEQAQAAAVAEERQRLSRELHDSVSQALYAISLGAQAARQWIDIEPARAVEPMDYILSLATAGLAEMRAMIFDLRPETLATDGLIAAIQRQTGSLLGRHQIAVDMHLGPEPQIALDAKEVLYRIAQEAIQNVVKHAKASRVVVSLGEADGGIVLTVQDDGRGFVMADDFPGHLGLTSMRERARRVGGSVTIESSPGSGATVRAIIHASAPP